MVRLNFKNYSKSRKQKNGISKTILVKKMKKLDFETYPKSKKVGK